MTPPRSPIHVTVAAVVEDRRGRFLVVEERAGGRRVLNQPAGHLEPGESLVEAVQRETLEESAWSVEPLGLVGIYRWVAPRGAVYLRTTFFARPLGQTDGPLDEGILAAHWLDAAQLQAASAHHRSPLVWRCVQDYLQGRRYPLELVIDLGASAPL